MRVHLLLIAALVQGCAAVHPAVPAGGASQSIVAVIVPGSGHGTFTDRAALVDLAIREFLEP